MNYLPLSVTVDEILDPARWRQLYAWGHIAGVGFQLAPGIPQEELNQIIQKTFGYLPDHTVQWHLTVALSELGALLHVPLQVQIVKTVPVDEGLRRGVDYHRSREPLPWVQSNVQTSYRIDVLEPVISVQRVRLQLNGTTVLTLDTDAQLETVRIVNRRTGHLHLMPAPGEVGLRTSADTLLNYAVNPGGGGIFERSISARGQTIPAAWLVDYTTGPMDENGLSGAIPAALAHWVWCKAGLTLMSLSGIAQGGGVASASVSIDGVSHSLGTTASAMYGLNSAYEEMLRKDIEALDVDFWRRKMTGVHAVVF